MINIQLLSLIQQIIPKKNVPSIDIASFGHPTTFLPNNHILAKELSACEAKNVNDVQMQKIFREKLNESADLYSFVSIVEKMSCTIRRLHIYDIDPREDPFLCWDLNIKLPQQCFDQYDLAIDSGTHEHVFNIGNSLINFANLPKLDGYAIGALPYFSPNHGFYNVNPNCIGELFCLANGYKLLSIIINGYQSPMHSLLGHIENRSIVYDASEKATQAEIWNKIQMHRIKNLSAYNTMYYVAKRIKVLNISEPIQHKYKS